MMECGKKIINVALEEKLFITVICTKENFRMESRMEKVFLNG